MDRCPRKSRKSRNRLRPTLMISGLPTLNSMGSIDRLLVSAIASQPLSQDWVKWIVGLWVSQVSSRNYLALLAKILKVYPHWVTESMLSNRELAIWIQSRLILLEEHPLWKQTLVDCDQS
uniref:Sigma 1s n=1 Tax=Mammalian orthoreovirus TaxID=351073 RepID=A0A346M2U3_9REOV|nr:sigma 1s [Mammalian orthoreovirus]